MSAHLIWDAVGPSGVVGANAFRVMGSGAVRILSALFGGIAIARIGIEYTFLFGAVAYLLAGVFILPTRPAAPLAIATESYLGALKTGLQVALNDLNLRNVLVVAFVVEAFGFSYMAMMPVVARDVLVAGGSGLGQMWAAIGVGQLIGTMALAMHRNTQHKGAHCCLPEYWRWD